MVVANCVSEPRVSIWLTSITEFGLHISRLWDGSCSFRAWPIYDGVRDLAAQRVA